MIPVGNRKVVWEPLGAQSLGGYPITQGVTSVPRPSEPQAVSSKFLEEPQNGSPGWLVIFAKKARMEISWYKFFTAAYSQERERNFAWQAMPRSFDCFGFTR